MCEKIRENTNKYAGFVKSATLDKWEPIGDIKWLWKPFEDIEELFSFIATILIMGIAKLPRIKDFWPSNPMLGNDKVKRTFARDSEEPNLTCTAWYEKKERKRCEERIASVKLRIIGNVCCITCPKAIAVYDKYMCAVDLADQYRKYYDIASK
ncbi:hypothetical protein AVEN_47712-1 [Araneus ventricosus]|uniref:PiggyBac transposable element-derived protein domain-containing protein n=1 Tax=Araneus ventricosus TaxID=182803 RepID=A0A4Y2IH95_ARAVE|nr:hypothetical protein AVEN_47712-1 [Araneus ventricosus]